jgi:hypothetical protein
MGQSETGFEQLSAPSTILSAPNPKQFGKKMRSSTGFDHLTYYFGNQKMASTGYYKPTINHTTSCYVMPA